MAKKSKKHIVKKILAWIGIVICIILVLSSATVFIARFVNAARDKMPEDSIHEHLTISLGGVDQHINIRGYSADNPIIIWLHGGPGLPDTFVTNTFQPELEKDYTFIRWDQRGCGRSYYLSPDAPLSFDLLLNDLDDLVDYAAERFHQPIIIAGHSWGTVLGTTYASTHPEKIAGFIGTGQVVTEQERFRVEMAIDRAKTAGEQEDAQEIFELYEQIKTMSAQGATFDDEAFMEKQDALDTLIDKYLIFKEPGTSVWQSITSPDFGWNDLRWQLRSMTASIDTYFVEGIDFTRPTQFETPVAFISGSEDITCTANGVEDYADRIIAPKVSVQIMEGFGHLPMDQDPKQYADVFRNALEFILD